MATNNQTPNLDQQVNSFFDWNYHLIPPEQKDEKWFLTLCKRYAPYMRGIYSSDFYGAQPYSTDLIKQYALGISNPEYYKQMFDPQYKEGAYLGLDFSKIPAVIPRFRQKLIADILKIPTEAKASAVDPIANDKRNKDKERLSIQKRLDAELAKLSSIIGYPQPIKSDITNRVLNNPMAQLNQQSEGQQAGDNFQFDLEDDTERSLYMDKNAGFYSQDVEIAQELTIESINKFNEIDNIKQLLIESAIDYGRAAMRVYCDKFSGLPSYQYLDIGNVLVSANWGKDIKKADCWAICPLMSLSEMIRTLGDCLKVGDLKEIYNNAVRMFGYRDFNNLAYPQWDGLNGRVLTSIDYDIIKCPVFYIEFRSPNTDVYEQSTTRYGDKKKKKKDFGYRAPQDSEYRKERKEEWYDVIYKGYYIQGIDRVYDFGMLNNMTRDKGNEQFTPFSLIYWKFDERSLTQRMIPHANNIVIAWLKMQFMLLKALPPGYSFNVDAMSDILDGDGGKITIIELQKMFYQTGSTLHHSLSEDGTTMLANSNVVHQELRNGIDPNIGVLWQTIINEKQMISDSIGLNEYTNAGTPPNDALVGIKNAAVSSSQDARFYLQYGMKKMMENCAARTSLMVQQIAKYSPFGWNKIKNMVGSYNAAIIESMDDIPLHEFAIYIEDQMTEQERQEVKQFLLQAYSQGKLELSDVLQIYWIKNYKLLARLLNLKYNKRQQQQLQAQQQGLQMQMKQESDMAQLKLMIAQIDAQSVKDAAEINGKYNLLAVEMKETGDMNKKMLQEIVKLRLAQDDKAHDHAITEKDNINSLREITAQKSADLEVTKLEGQNTIDAAKAQPKTPAK